MEKIEQAISECRRYLKDLDSGIEFPAADFCLPSGDLAKAKSTQERRKIVTRFLNFDLLVLEKGLEAAWNKTFKN